jgi:hypothetical protein
VLILSAIVRIVVAVVYEDVVFQVVISLCHLYTGFALSKTSKYVKLLGSLDTEERSTFLVMKNGISK